MRMRMHVAAAPHSSRSDQSFIKMKKKGEEIEAATFSLGTR